MAVKHSRELKVAVDSRHLGWAHSGTVPSHDRIRVPFQQNFTELCSAVPRRLHEAVVPLIVPLLEVEPNFVSEPRAKLHVSGGRSPMDRTAAPSVEPLRIRPSSDAPSAGLYAPPEHSPVEEIHAIVRDLLRVRP